MSNLCDRSCPIFQMFRDECKDRECPTVGLACIAYGAPNTTTDCYAYCCVKDSNMVAVVSIVIAVIVVVVIACGVFIVCYCCRKKKEKRPRKSQLNRENLVQTQLDMNNDGGFLGDEEMMSSDSVVVAHNVDHVSLGDDGQRIVKPPTLSPPQQNFEYQRSPRPQGEKGAERSPQRDTLDFPDRENPKQRAARSPRVDQKRDEEQFLHSSQQSAPSRSPRKADQQQKNGDENDAFLRSSQQPTQRSSRTQVATSEISRDVRHDLASSSEDFFAAETPSPREDRYRFRQDISRSPHPEERLAPRQQRLADPEYGGIPQRNHQGFAPKMESSVAAFSGAPQLDVEDDFGGFGDEDDFFS